VGRFQTVADAIRAQDASCVAEFRRTLLVPFNNNLVPRPWGGSRMLAYKNLDGVPDAAGSGSVPVGESFEIAAFDDDAEAERHPSVLACSDGSTVELPELLAAYGDVLLGDAFVARYGRNFPLLPKTLDVKELLSVQGHPAGHTEAYIIIDADPGATIQLGFAADVDAAGLAAELTAGRRQQAELLELLRSSAVAELAVHALLAPWLAARHAPPEDIAGQISRWLESESDWPAARALLDAMKRLYWRVLDSLNTVPASAGQVIHNATPARLLADAAALPSAEVHALGNPEGRAILALEIRRPGPTFRAWDNLRFPVRDVDVATALSALNLRATTSDDFLVIPELVPGRPGVYCSIDSAYFRIEHLRPAEALGDGIRVADAAPHCVHVISGTAELRRDDDSSLGILRRGQSALMPVDLGAYRVTGSGEACEIVKVNVPV